MEFNLLDQLRTSILKITQGPMYIREHNHDNNGESCTSSTANQIKRKTYQKF